MTDANSGHPHRFADLADHELLRLLRDESLDAAAGAAALREARRRRLAPAAPQPAAPPKPSPTPSPPPAQTAIAAEDYAFVADHFTDNPYQTPQSAAPPDSPRSRRTGTVNALWWLHITVLALYTLFVAYNLTVSGRLTTFPLGFLAALVLCVVGMVGWRLQRALLHQWVWGLLGVGALLYSVMLLFSLVAIVFVEVPGLNVSRPTMFALGAAGALIVLPLTWGLTGYAFRSKSLC